MLIIYFYSLNLYLFNMILKADLHLHTVLSPCGDLDMSPVNIINEAKNKDLKIIGITDHNSTLNAKTCFDIAQKNGIYVLCGAEVTTSEEVHCVCFMPDFDTLNLFQKYLDKHVIFFQNNPDKFGYQFVVDENEDIVDEVQHLLINAQSISLAELQKKVEELNGIFIPAHIDRSTYSISSQLGFLPPDLKFDALELSPFAFRNNFFEKMPWFKNFNYICDSDAHFLKDIAKIYNTFDIDTIDFNNIKNAIRKGTNIENY